MKNNIIRTLIGFATYMAAMMLATIYWFLPSDDLVAMRLGAFALGMGAYPFFSMAFDGLANILKQVRE